MDAALEVFAAEIVLHCLGRNRVSGIYHGTQELLSFWNKQIAFLKAINTWQTSYLPECQTGNAGFPQAFGHRHAARTGATIIRRYSRAAAGAWSRKACSESSLPKCSRHLIHARWPSLVNRTK
jgi:hypothetical protein